MYLFKKQTFPRPSGRKSKQTDKAVSLQLHQISSDTGSITRLSPKMFRQQPHDFTHPTPAVYQIPDSRPMLFQTDTDKG